MRCDAFWRRFVLRYQLLIALFGCSLADPSLLDPLRGDAATRRDSSVDVDSTTGTDAGETAQDAVDDCGDDDVLVLTDTREDIRIDTRELISEVSSLPGCSEAVSVPGPDAFFAVDVVADEYWHFHLRVDARNDPEPSARNPVLLFVE